MTASLRTPVHALFVLVLLHALAPIAHNRPGTQILFALAGPAGFVPFAASLAAALNADRLILAAIFFLIAVLGWPDKIAPYALAAILGATIGATVRSLVRSEQHHGTTTPDREPGQTTNHPH